MPGNQFILGVTHTVHEFSVTSGTFFVDVTELGQTDSFMNGMQLILVPEPGIVIALGTGAIGLLLTRKYASASAATPSFD